MLIGRDGESSTGASLRGARIGLLALCLFLPVLAAAESLVLVQGYLGDGKGWRESGITAALERAGWRDGGHLDSRRGRYRERAPRASLRYYTLALPTEAPLMRQARVLSGYIEAIRAWHPEESLILVGHSAGGVLGRLYMVQHPKTPVAALITIASPHLGTDRAELGAMLGQSPLGWIAPIFGAQVLNRSQGLYRDLVRERPGSLLFWLNRQEHPKARYISVVRTEDSLLGLGDLVVPAWSQDMNNVYALRGRAVTVRAPGEHALEAKDGALLVRLLRRLRSS